MPDISMNKSFVRYFGLFDFHALYSAIIDWCKSYGYEWQEETYKHKVPSAMGAEQEFKWIASKEVTDYIGYKIKMAAQIRHMNEVEVVKDGKKKMLTSGRMEIVITPVMTIDWQKRFKGGKWAVIIGKWYNTVRRREIESVYGDTLYYRTYHLQAVMKKFFDLQAKAHEYEKYVGEH